MKKILSLALTLAMIISCVPMLSITASAETQTYVLFDASIIDTSTHGDIAPSTYGWTGNEGTVFSSQWSTGGTWNTAPWGAAGLMFWRVGPRQNSDDETKVATLSDGAMTAGADRIVIEYTFAMQDQDNNYQTWRFNDLDGNAFATVYYDQGVKATTGPGGGGDGGNVYADGKDAVYALRGTPMKIEAVRGGSSWTVSYTSNGRLVGTDSVASVNGIGSISAIVAQWNNQYAAMAMQGLKITVDIDADAHADAIWANLQNQSPVSDGMKVRENLKLTTANGISWESDDPAAIDPNTGVINRPGYGEGEKNVRLTMVWNGNRKDYTVALLPLDAGDSLIATLDFDKGPVGAKLSAEPVTANSIYGCGKAARISSSSPILLTAPDGSILLAGANEYTVTYDKKTSAGWTKVTTTAPATVISNIADILAIPAEDGEVLVDNVMIFNRAHTAQEIAEYTAANVTPIMSVSGGSESRLTDTFDPITITHPSGAGYIYYTLDGSDPTAASNKYEGPFYVNGAAQVKARTIASNGLMSKVVDAWVYNQPWGGTAAEFRIEGENTVNNVKIAWPLYGGATRYEVYQGDRLVGSTIGDALDDYDLEVNKNYTYTVKAYNGDELVAEGTTNTVMTFAIHLEDTNGYDDNVNYQDNIGGWKPNDKGPSEPKPSGYHIGDKYYSTNFTGVSEKEWTDLGFDPELFKKACSVVSIRYKESDDGINWPDEWTFAYPIILDMRLEGKQTGFKTDGKTISFSAHAEGNGFACSKLFFATFTPGGEGTVDPYYVTAATGQLIPYAEKMEQYELIDDHASNQLSGWYVGRPFGKYDSRDMVRFVDGDNLYTFSATNNNNDMLILKLQDNWVLPDRVENIILKGQHQESPSVFHDGNAYYVYTSTTNGWFQSQARYSSAPTLDSPWSPLREVANSGTFGTQANGVWGYGSESGRVVQRGHGYNWGQSGGWRKNNYQIFFHLAINNGIATGNWCYRMEYDPYWGAIAVQSGELVSLGKKATVEGKDAPYITDNTQLQSSKVTDVEKLPYDIIVDLEKPTVISEVNLTNAIYMGSVCASYFKVYGSNDQSNWTEISDVTSDDYDDGAFRVGWVDDKTPYRYVKVTVLEVKNLQGGGQSALWGGKPLELAIYGKPEGYVDQQYEFTDEILVGYNRLNVDFEPYGQKPVIVNSRTLVPLRAIFETMGAEIDWNEATQTVTATRGGTTISLTIGSDQLYVNGEAKTIDTPAQIINNRTMVPVRAIAESFNCEVNWNDGARRVYIKEAE